VPPVVALVLPIVIFVALWAWLYKTMSKTQTQQDQRFDTNVSPNGAPAGLHGERHERSGSVYFVGMMAILLYFSYLSYLFIVGRRSSMAWQEGIVWAATLTVLAVLELADRPRLDWQDWKEVLGFWLIGFGFILDHSRWQELVPFQWVRSILAPVIALLGVFLVFWKRRARATRPRSGDAPY